MLTLATANIAQAVHGADLILCPVPATAHASIAPPPAPHLEADQVMFPPPGTFGAYFFTKAAHDAGAAADIAFAEAGALPYLARKSSLETIAIATRATRLPTGVFPLARRDRALAVLRQAHPAVRDAGDALSGTLMNAGPIIHPPLILTNAGAIERFQRWDIQNEGAQPAVRREMDTLDAERIAVREALG